MSPICFSSVHPVAASGRPCRSAFPCCAPPVLAALHVDQVLPEGKAVLYQAAAQVVREVTTVAASIGDEDAGLVGHRYPNENRA